ncbi:MAG: hypothetical protein GY810_24530 [Aureispira sp.]|nr:hypothetical protein [Aureispira sp.]
MEPMKHQKLTHILTFLGIFLFSCVSTLSIAQYDDPVDSNSVAFQQELARQLRLQKLDKIKANDSIQSRVDAEVNKHRLEMLTREWWGLPTMREAARLDKARYERYDEYMEPLGLNKNRSNPIRYRGRSGIEDEQNLIVMGWHPHWQGDAYKTYNYKLLTHIAFHSYEVNPFTGSYNNFQAIYDFKYGDLIPTAHLDTCNVLLTVSSHGMMNNEIFFTSEPIVQDNLIDSLLSIVLSADADGIDINFEEVPVEYKLDFIKFVKELSFAMRETNSNYTITMTVPMHDPNNVYDLEALAAWVDYFVITGYNFHITESGLKKGPMAPLLAKDANVRGTHFRHIETMTLDSLLRVPYTIQNIVVLHSEEHIKLLTDSLHRYIQQLAASTTDDYNEYDLAEMLRVIRLSDTRRGDPLMNHPTIEGILRRTWCEVELLKDFKPGEPVKFFLFKPKWNVFDVKERDLFQRITTVTSKVDSSMFDLRALVEEYKKEIGEGYEASLIMALPYHGAVWNIRGEKDEFEGYLPYSEVRHLISVKRAKLYYDKATQSLKAIVSDTLGPSHEIFFDNSTSLGLKYDFTIEEGLGGIALWSLGADHSHQALWTELETAFATKRFWNTQANKYEKLKISKSNKVGYTIEYTMRRFRNLILATLFFVAIFIAISFIFSLLDWKVRDVLFYSGAFRIFYLVLFTVLVLVFGSYVGLFKNKMATFLIGTLLGILLTWIASTMVDKEHDKLP